MSQREGMERKQRGLDPVQALQELGAQAAKPTGKLGEAVSELQRVRAALSSSAARIREFNDRVLGEIPQDERAKTERQPFPNTTMGQLSSVIAQLGELQGVLEREVSRLEDIS